MNLVTNNEIAFKSRKDAMDVANLLMNNGYVVMISVEEKLTIVNYVWTPNGADRNNVVFEDRGVIEEEIFKE